MSVPPTPAISVDSTYIDPPRLNSPDSRSSSRRVSLDVPGHPQSLTPTSPKPRRNRSALRQFYGLQQDAVAEEGPGKGSEPVEEKLGEIDRDGFEAEAYVEKLVSTAELKELLRKENELVNEIRGFDGERKALVYDNYSKLITATDTIRKMRANMEPLAPTTSTLGPAIAHIAQVSASLVQNIPPSPVATTFPSSNKRNKETVAWALACPEKIEELVRDGQGKEAERVFALLEAILGKWQGVRGTEELRQKAKKALGTNLGPADNKDTQHTLKERLVVNKLHITTATIASHLLVHDTRRRDIKPSEKSQRRLAQRRQPLLKKEGMAGLLKCTGIFSLGILSGVHINFATATIQTILDLSSAAQAKRAFTISLALLRQIVRPLEITASATLFMAFLFGGRGRRHPYLLMTGLMPVLAIALEKAKMTGVEIGVESTQTERKRRSGESVEINGEVVMGGLQKWRGWGLVRSGILSFGFALGVVGIWGEP